MRLGADTGGTFTDLVADDGRSVKVLSSPSDPAQAVAKGIAAFGDEPLTALAHGTTVATNALLERRGARVALVTNAGFADVIEIGRQDRPSLYDQWADRPAPLVARQDRHEVAGRLSAAGQELEPVDLMALPAVDDADAVAVCLLHSDLDGVHERAIGDALAARGHDVSCSVDVSPEFREYERTLTTVVNAYLRPICRTYLRGLAPLAAEVLVMTSAGGLADLATASELPVALLLSGPAGGVLAAAAAATANGFADAITFDMGGTSTDVCLVLGGVPEAAAERVVGGFPIRRPALDIHTIGAGGGSIARIDAGGALVVGPRSAGAEPGPACYGRGGTEATVTDANLVLGRMGATPSLPGLGALDREAASAALAAAGVEAAGVVAVVDAAMEQALRAVSVGRGVDPRGLALVAFGGAGPMHACDLADALGMPAVVVPGRAGVLSAVGLLGAARQHTVVRSWPVPGSAEGLDAALTALGIEAAAGLGAGATVETALDCRYAGQGHELTVASIAAFHEEHRRRNGYARADAPVEIVALRARAQVLAPSGVAEVPVPERAAVVGPAVIVEDDCTVVVPDGWEGTPGVAGALVLRRRGS
jgi:N-methylhydantoinase A/oxoprolinase/acetone carboxylase beta subunit